MPVALKDATVHWSRAPLLPPPLFLGVRHDTESAVSIEALGEDIDCRCFKVACLKLWARSDLQGGFLRGRPFYLGTPSERFQEVSDIELDRRQPHLETRNEAHHPFYSFRLFRVAIVASAFLLTAGSMVLSRTLVT
ncbi:MAG: hypothetical protein JWO71_576 [Candidatus Acidoferrum typicum]|nr:hypothetical protein [Candidatus Acidoferrum typicum]